SRLRGPVLVEEAPLDRAQPEEGVQVGGAVVAAGDGPLGGHLDHDASRYRRATVSTSTGRGLVAMHRSATAWVASTGTSSERTPSAPSPVGSPIDSVRRRNRSATRTA